MIASLLALATLAAGFDDAPSGAHPSAKVQAPVLASSDEPASRAARDALERGLAFLARRQADAIGGSFPKDGDEYAPVGVTALGALAFLAAGNTPSRGPYGAELGRAVDFLLEMSDLAPASETFGYIAHGKTDRKFSQHGHGFATLVLAEVHGMSPERGGRVERALEAAVRRIERSQGSEGGWEYSPLRGALHEGSVTICLVQALRAARNSGIRVEPEVIHRAEDYVLKLQKDDGEFRYMLDDPRSTTALTAAGVSTLNMAGRYDDSTIRNAVDAIWKGVIAQRDDSAVLQWPYYQRLYIAQAFWQLADTTHFERWFQAERELLIKTQNEDGSWRDSRFGDCYATAMNCLVLAIPEGVLPIFQR